TYEQQGAFAEAIGSLKSWIESYQNNTNVQPRLLSQAHFDLARLSYRMQPGTNAVNLFEEFCKKFPDDMNVPLAQYIMGEYYFGQGDYGKAELQFQNRALLQNTNPATREISFRARLMAGRAAVARQSYRSAREHFDWIITNGPLHVAASPIPVSIVAEAYLFRGDTFTLEPGLAETNQLARFGEAINAYSKVTENWPTNEFAPIAWGRIGECHLQLAAVDPKRYDMAADAFTKVIQSTANIAIRSQAEFELGVVREKQASLLPEADRRRRLDEAMDHYLRVLYGRNLRAGESPDPYWVKRAGLAAAELAESQNRPEIAISVYRRLLTEIPVLRSRLEKKIEELSKLVSSNGTTNRQVN
ncbi:MAG: tetratricopeptide repeat protein, partial [Verrucomicrobiae bacterium]|nr:tetratricopeptide repeat protein [Verrucomicrobiae bacterium]